MELLRKAVPGLAALASYERGWVTHDLVAGITVWAILVPQAMGYAALAGVPSVYGLYTAFGALLLYWLWGSSRELNVGPESTVAIMVATILAPLASTGAQVINELLDGLEETHALWQRTMAGAEAEAGEETLERALGTGRFAQRAMPFVAGRLAG